MKRFNDLSWWYWTATALLLAGSLAGCPLGLTPVVALVLVQVAHFTLRTGEPTSFPVQVRLGYLAMLLAGLWGPLGFFHWIQMAGTLAAITVDYCLMARMVSLLPWNRSAPIDGRLIRRTFFSRPVAGSILSARPCGGLPRARGGRRGRLPRIPARS
jgi:hypothetical protein